MWLLSVDHRRRRRIAMVTEAPLALWSMTTDTAWLLPLSGQTLGSVGVFLGGA